MAAAENALPAAVMISAGDIALVPKAGRSH